MGLLFLPTVRTSRLANSLVTQRAEPSRGHHQLRKSESVPKMGKLPERKSDFRSGQLRSEVKLQSKLHVARVAGASNASEVVGGKSQGRVAQAAQGIVRAVENIEEVRLEHQAHAFSGQFEVFAERQVRHENVRAGEGAHAVCSRTYWRWDRKGKRIKELARSGRGEGYASNTIRAPPIHGNVGERRIRQYGDRRTGLYPGYTAQLPAAKRGADEPAPMPEQRRVVEISCGEDVPAVKVRYAVVIPSITPIIGVCTKSAGVGQRLRPRVTDRRQEVALPLRCVNLERVVIGRTIAQIHPNRGVSLVRTQPVEWQRRGKRPIGLKLCERRQIDIWLTQDMPLLVAHVRRLQKDSPRHLALYS